MTDELGADAPLTTDELSEKQIGQLSLPDQIRYAVFNENYRLSEICETTTFSKDWTTDILEDMVEDGDLLEGSDQSGLFYTLPIQNDQCLDPDEREEIHAEALKKYKSQTVIGDEHDVSANMDTDTTDTIEAEHESSTADASTVANGADADTDDTVSGPRADDADVQLARAKHGGQLPVDRDYDWNDEKLPSESVPEFVSANGEKEDIIKEIEDRRETGKLPHFRVVGPTGCGKTSLAEDIALGMNAPCFTINCHEGLRPQNLLGLPTYVGDETWWVDGPLPKALLASQKRPVVVIFDEVNRTTARTLGVIMDFLDHRAKVTLNSRGGETIYGDPMNLIVFSTMNEGDGYVVNNLDRAQKRRFGNVVPTDYIGVYNKDTEASLISERTPVSEDVAVEMVEAANSIREKASDRDSSVKMGVPTSTMLDWARTAWSYRDDDPDGGPLVKSAHRSVIDMYFRGDDEANDVVTTTIESHLRGMDIDHEDEDDDDDSIVDNTPSIDVSDDTWLLCDDCGWYEEVGDAPSEVVTTMQCPKCDDSQLTPREAN